MASVSQAWRIFGSFHRLPRGETTATCPLWDSLIAHMLPSGPAVIDEHLTDVVPPMNGEDCPGAGPRRRRAACRHGDRRDEDDQRARRDRPRAVSVEVGHGRS